MSAVTTVPTSLLQALKAVHRDIFCVDLKQNTANYLFSEQEIDTATIPQWDSFFYEYSHFMFEKHRNQALAIMSCSGLRMHYETGQERFTLEYPYRDGKEQRWLSFNVVIESGVIAYVTVSHASQDEFLRKLADRYVHNKGDEFVCIDAMNDRYIVMDGPESGTQVMTNICIGYKAAMERYVKRYVAEEDTAWILEAANLTCVKEELREKKLYSFSCGEEDEDGQYVRKLWQYRYYDEVSQIILLRRMDITESYKEQQKLMEELHQVREAAQRDSLTGVFNHKATGERISQELEHNNDCGALLFLDLDNFKQVNDIFGHQAGDEALRRAVGIMRHELDGEIYYIGRIGGDEFVIFLPHIGRQDAAEYYAHRICYNLQTLSVGSHSFHQLSASIGIAIAPHDGRTYGTLLRRADERAYHAKNSGKNRYASR